MNDLKTCKVIIFGEEYALATNEAELHLLQSANMVDSMMRTLAEHSKLRESKRIAVLVSLRLASTVVKLEHELNALKKTERELIDAIDHELVNSCADL